ncbi:MAG TPA: Fic family protein [Thermomicrobiales bacterium]|jgi:Fic family protein|nr:Fic family protein [Thermomicrobiales bacterium]
MRREDFTADAPGRLVVAPEGHLAYVPDPLPPQFALELSTVNLLADAERALGELKGVGQRLPNPHLLINPFLRREAVLSSRIEGTTTGLQQLLLFETAPSDEPGDSDVREVANYVAALELGFSLLEKLPVSLRLIREVHERLMQDVRGQEQRPGEFRHIPNLIGHRGAIPDTARFVPPPVKEMHAALHDLERYIGERRDDLPFLIQLALVHYQFEVIHPFMDGNGRVGRLLIALQLRERAYLPQPLLYLSAYFEYHRDAYRDHLLAVSRSGTWTEWIDFFLQGVAEQSTDTVQRSYQLLDLLQRYQSWALSTTRSANLARLVELVLVRPVISISNVEEWLGVTQPGASRLVQQLVDRGILEEVTGRQRNRRFAALEILEILDAPEK